MWFRFVLIIGAAAFLGMLWMLFGPPGRAVPAGAIAPPATGVAAPVAH